MTEHVRLLPEVNSREVDGQVIALDLAGGRYLRVNPSGAVLWPLLQRGTSVAELVEQLTSAFALSPERARADVEAWLAWLDAEGLLLAHDPRDPSPIG